MVKKVLRVLKRTLNAFTVLAEGAEMQRHFHKVRSSDEMTARIDSWNARQNRVD